LIKRNILMEEKGKSEKTKRRMEDGGSIVE
jgi:hypothetical protein